MNVLSSLLNFIGNKIGNTSMGTTATTLTGAIAEIRNLTKSALTEKKTYTDIRIRGVYGYVTTGGTVANLYVPLTFAKDITSVDITSFKASIRISTGGYLGGSDGVELASYFQAVSIPDAQPIVYIRLVNANGFGATNNTNCAGDVVMTFTLS